MSTKNDKIVKCDNCPVISQCTKLNVHGGKCLMSDHNKQVKSNVNKAK